MQAVGCAPCHGDGGISERPGIPSLVGQDPQYLVPAMKAYTIGERNHDLMRLVLTGVGEAELHDIALYYARQIPARAQTPPVGDPSAGRRATTLCAGCHGEQGVSVYPGWPSLAGQDAQYLADAIKAYKHGGRNKAVACAGCHGDGGISKRPGMPSLVGQDPQYLVPAMNAYVTGQRKHGLMKAALSGVSEAELHDIAVFYARQIPARAQTPPIGDPAAGRTATALCANCHGEQGVSVYPGWPSLAGQDAQYLADAIKAYKDGSRSKAVACAGCHGDGGISRRPGMPSLVGLDPQYLVPVMKAYISGQRKHDLMRVLVSGVSDADLNNIALYYARQTPARAQTPAVGDPAAGKAATALCANCHGEQGVSASPMWPSLAGQDAQYLADAIAAYKDGSRSKTIACAGCHGEGGISKQAGMPSLVGLNPQYLVPAMKAYATGQRKHALMSALLSGVGEAELSDIALYYARQTPHRAQTPAVGDPAAGKTATALCANCHGEQGVSVSADWPSLAGQDAQYVVSAITAYKDGSRSKTIACAGCHGEGGISKRPGMPSLVGLHPQYLVAAMKAYAAGQRKHALMSALLSGVGEAELNDIALYYARQTPVRAQTPAVGDPAAGKTASAACAGCHGEQGASANPMWPSLAGQDARYLADALRAYKDGSRDDATMKALAATLDENAINNIASYYASLAPVQPSLPNNTQNARAGREPILVRNGLVASLDERTIRNIASYYASLAPAQPSLPNNAQNARAVREPILVRNGLVASLDERTIRNIASYYASLGPAQSNLPKGAQNAAARREPVVVRNVLVAALDERTISNVASYYASLRPEQPASGRRAPAGREPARVSMPVTTDGRSVGGIISFRSNDPSRRAEDNNAICLTCHERGDRTYWNGSVHESRALACTDCHTLMRQVSLKANLKTKTELETCFQCHKDRRAQIFRSSHMPIREGKIVCSNCHNPHGSATEALLRENSINDNCYKCHAEKRGPFLFEHAPVRENCLSCHDPHGTNNEYLLKVSRPRLCAECHGFGHGAVFSGPLAVESFGRSCQNCHTAVHGSNSPSGALLHR